MTAITSTGIGSGLDVNSIVSQLVAAERGPADTRLATAQSGAQVSISALGQLSSLLSTLSTASAALKTGGTTGLNQLTATSSNTDLYTASAAGKAVSGNYNVEVLALAQANKLSSGLYASSSAIVGSGDVSIAVGTSSFKVTLSDGANTLADLRDKINAATDNTGVGAAIVSDSGGARLLLTSRATGTANALTVTSSLLTTTQTQPALDAQVKVDGFLTTSSSNQVTTAVDGLTLNLVKASPGTVTNLGIARDQGASTTAVQTFVNAYNNVVKYIGAQTAYDPTAKQGGTLLGDAVTLSASQQLRNIVGGSTTGTGSYSNLAQLGITTATDGTLTLDSAKLGTALSTDFTSVQKLLGGTTGIGTKVSSLADALTDSSSGQIKAETDGYSARLKDISKQQDDLNQRMTDFEARTRAQFTALDTLMAGLKSTGDYLTQQLAQINKTTTG